MIDAEQVGQALNHVLGNTCRMARTAKSYEWNARGPGCRPAAEEFREQACEMHGSIEPIAFHIMGLGWPPVLDYTDQVVALNPPTIEAIPSLLDMIRELSAGHEQSGISVLAVLDVASEAGEHATMTLMSARIDAHRRHRHNLLRLVESLGMQNEA